MPTKERKPFPIWAVGLIILAVLATIAGLSLYFN